LKKSKTNSFLINAFNNYKQNMKDMYNIYMGDPHYKDFINVLNTSLREKRKDPNSKYRFLQAKSKDDIKKANFDMSVVFDEKERKKISQKFVDTLSSQKFIDEVKSEYKDFKANNIDKVYENVSKFYKDQEKEVADDKQAKEQGEKFMKSINNFIGKHRDEYKQEGILTVDGKVSNNPIEYIAKEEKMLKEKYKEENYSLEDVDKLMKLDQILM
jgi:hypothetical protein